MLFDDIYTPVDNCKCKGADDEANKGIEDSIFGLFGFRRITGRSHVVNATDDDIDYGDEATDADDDFQNVGNNTNDVVAGATATGGSLNFG